MFLVGQQESNNIGQYSSKYVLVNSRTHRSSLWGFLHLKSELIREAENQKTDKNHRKTVKYGSIFEGEIT